MPGRFTPGEETRLIRRWASLTAGPEKEKNLIPLRGFEPRTVQPIADYAITAAQHSN
jgi:hypothetical protein